MKRSLVLILLIMVSLVSAGWAEARTYVVRPGGHYHSGYHYPRAYYPRSYYRPYYYPYAYYPRPYIYAAPVFGPFGYYPPYPYYYPAYYGGGVNVYYNTPGFSISVGSGY